MNVAVMKTKAEAALGEQFEAVAARLPGTGWVKELRKQAIGAFEALGLPHRRIEEWKYTDLRERLREAFPPARGRARAQSSAGELEAALGQLAALDADRIGVRRWTLPCRPVGHGQAAMTASSSRRMGETLAAAPDVAAGQVRRQGADQRGSGARAECRVHDRRRAAESEGRAGSGAPVHAGLRPHWRGAERGHDAQYHQRRKPARKLTLIEAHVALPGAAREAPGQRRDRRHHRRGRRGHAHQVRRRRRRGDTSVDLDREDRQGCRLSMSSSSPPGAASRATSCSRPSPARARKLDISGVFLGRGSDHIDTTLVVDHAVPGCESRELFKGVLDGRARGIFQGKVIVRPRRAEDRRQADGAGR